MAAQEPASGSAQQTPLEAYTPSSFFFAQGTVAEREREDGQPRSLCPVLRGKTMPIGALSHQESLLTRSSYGMKASMPLDGSRAEGDATERTVCQLEKLRRRASHHWSEFVSCPSGVERSISYDRGQQCSATWLMKPKHYRLG